MFLLPESDYYKALPLLDTIPINTIFARLILVGRTKGKVYVNDLNDPQTFYVVHPFTMTLLFGRWDDEQFNTKFLAHALNTEEGRSNIEYMQAWPQQWDRVLPELFGDKLIAFEDNTTQQIKGIIELNTRVNFKLFPEDTKGWHLPEGVEVVRTDANLYTEMSGSVVASEFYTDADDFVKNGVGFSVLENGKLASAAFAAFIIGKDLEIGIETIPAFRGKGYAKYCCSALIAWCLDNGYEPIWACRKANLTSYYLAQKVGFRVSWEIPYYRLSN